MAADAAVQMYRNQCSVGWRSLTPADMKMVRWGAQGKQGYVVQPPLHLVVRCSLPSLSLVRINLLGQESKVMIFVMVAPQIFSFQDMVLIYYVWTLIPLSTGI
jgi:hypothetical protein